MGSRGRAPRLGTTRTRQVSGYERRAVRPRLQYYAPVGGAGGPTAAEEVADGLSRRRKRIHPKFFYDERGSALFERICRIPEYYIARAESMILRRIGPDVEPTLRPGTRLVELGSGSSGKTGSLIDMLDGVQERTEYVPIDVSDSILDGCGRWLEHFPGLSVTAIIDTYCRGLDLERSLGGGPRMTAFLGSSFGNFGPGEGRAFLRRMRSRMADGDTLLIGLDMGADSGALAAAYDDPGGATAAFNLNVLSRINRELGADFDVSQFEHVAVFNEGRRRVEMYLRSLRRQAVSVPGCGMVVELGEGELIHTEHSHKYTAEQIYGMMEGAGLEVDTMWHDPGSLYALSMCSAR